MLLTVVRPQLSAKKEVQVYIYHLILKFWEDNLPQVYPKRFRRRSCDRWRQGLQAKTGCWFQGSQGGSRQSCWEEEEVNKSVDMLAIQRWECFSLKSADLKLLWQSRRATRKDLQNKQIFVGCAYCNHTANCDRYRNCYVLFVTPFLFRTFFGGVSIVWEKYYGFVLDSISPCRSFIHVHLSLFS